MFRALIRSLGVDYEQWRALTRVALKLDFRTASGLSAHQRSEKTEGAYQIVVRYAIYVALGAMLSGLVWMSGDVFFSGIIILSYTMVMTGMMVLVDFAAVVVSPDDFAILGYQPVSSRTFFFSRLTNVLVYTTLLSAALGLIPVITYFFAGGFRPLLGLSAAVATLLSCVCTTLLLVVVYTSVLKVVHPNRLRRVIGYLQLVLSFFIFGGYSLLPRMLNIERLSQVTITKSAWLMAYPPAWFASYLELAMGRWGKLEVVPALLSIVALIVLAGRARGKLALEYSDRLSAAAAVSEGSKKSASAASRSGLIFRGGEARAVALLVRNQFKYDQKFRLAVLGIVPLTVMYLYMGMDHGPLADPFVVRGGGFGNSFLVYLAVLMFPPMLMMNLTASDSYQASWIYYSTPADRGRLVRGAKDFVFMYFVLPYLAFIGAVFQYYFRNLWHVVLNLCVLGLLSHFFLQLAVFLNPLLPFSQPARKGRRTAGYMMAILFGPIGAILLLFVLSRWIFPNRILLGFVLLGLAGLSWLMEKLLQVRVERRTASLEYQD
jgi:hypothetical protein